MSVEVLTFGCRLNAYESEVIRREAAEAGLADAIVVNTCAVTAEAERQARQAIRKRERERPQARIIVTGCAAQIESAALRRHGRGRPRPRQCREAQRRSWSAAADALARRATSASPRRQDRVNDIMAVRETAGHLIEGFDGRAAPSSQVQNGCDHRCTFCIIPFGRGPSRSVPMGEVVEQVRRLVGNGYREVVLTGVDITTYGADLPGDAEARHAGAGDPAPCAGAGAAAALLASTRRGRRRAVRRLRRGAAADAASASLAAGRRRHHPQAHEAPAFAAPTRSRRARRLRQLRPDMVFGADLIAGFPTETEAMFGARSTWSRNAGSPICTSFPISPRPGTPAARMPQVARDIAKERARRLREAGAAALRRHLDGEVGRCRLVLTEIADSGRSEHFTAVRFDRPVEAGVIVEARMSGHDGRRLIAA